jgi:hypothetical protein
MSIVNVYSRVNSPIHTRSWRPCIVPLPRPAGRTRSSTTPRAPSALAASRTRTSTWTTSWRKWPSTQARSTRPVCSSRGAPKAPRLWCGRGPACTSSTPALLQPSQRTPPVGWWHSALQEMNDGQCVCVRVCQGEERTGRGKVCSSRVLVVGSQHVRVVSMACVLCVCCVCVLQCVCPSRNCRALASFWRQGTASPPRCWRVSCRSAGVRLCRACHLERHA